MHCSFWCQYEKRGFQMHFFIWCNLFQSGCLRVWFIMLVFEDKVWDFNPKYQCSFFCKGTGLSLVHISTLLSYTHIHTFILWELYICMQYNALESHPSQPLNQLLQISPNIFLPNFTFMYVYVYISVYICVYLHIYVSIYV